MRGVASVASQKFRTVCVITYANDKMGHFFPGWQVELSSASDGIAAAIKVIGDYLTKHPIEVAITGQGRATAKRPIIILEQTGS